MQCKIQKNNIAFLSAISLISFFDAYGVIITFLFSKFDKNHKLSFSIKTVQQNVCNNIRWAKF